MSTDQTPALERATAELMGGLPGLLPFIAEAFAHVIVSAALHDPADPDALQRVIDRAIVENHKDLRSMRAERVYRGEKAIEAALVEFLLGARGEGGS